MSGVGGIIFLTVGLGLSLLVILTSFNSLLSVPPSPAPSFTPRLAWLSPSSSSVAFPNETKRDKGGWFYKLCQYVLYMYLLPIR